ncbi:MAG: hypothetical protein ACLFV2_08180 [Desulfurivibrionaceae bacterium]
MLDKPLDGQIEAVRSRKKSNLPTVLGHADVKTTERYTHVMDKDISRIRSPLDSLGK